MCFNEPHLNIHFDRYLLTLNVSGEYRVYVTRGRKRNFMGVNHTRIRKMHSKNRLVKMTRILVKFNQCGW